MYTKRINTLLDKKIYELQNEGAEDGLLFYVTPHLRAIPGKYNKGVFKGSK